MGDEHGREVLTPCEVCEEPSGAAGSPCLRPAAPCRRRETTTAPGRLSPCAYRRKRQTRTPHNLQQRGHLYLVVLRTSGSLATALPFLIRGAAAAVLLFAASSLAAAGPEDAAAIVWKGQTHPVATNGNDFQIAD